MLSIFDPCLVWGGSRKCCTTHPRPYWPSCLVSPAISLIKEYNFLSFKARSFGCTIGWRAGGL